MKDSEFDALLRSALLEAARLDAEALTEGEPEAPPRSLEYQAEMAALLRDPIRGDAAKRQRSAGRQAKTRLFRALYVQKRRARFARVDRCQARDERFHVHRMLVKQA